MKFSEFLTNEGFLDNAVAAVKGGVAGAKKAVQRNKTQQQTQQAYKGLEQAVQQLISAGFPPENITKQVQTIATRLTTTTPQVQMKQSPQQNQTQSFKPEERVVLDPKRNLSVSREEIEKRKRELQQKYSVAGPASKTNADYTDLFK